MAPLAIPVFADVSVATPGENAYLDINFQKGANNTDVVNKCLLVTDRTSFWVGAKLTTTYQIDMNNTYQVKFDIKPVNPNGGIRPLDTANVDVDNGADDQGVKFNTGVAIADGWYTHTINYVPKTNHAFELRLCGGLGGGAVNSTDDFYIDNFVLIENGTPVFTYDFKDSSQFGDWSYDRGSHPDATGTLLLTSDPTPETDIGAGVAFNTGLTVEAGKTYRLEYALSTNVAGANYFLNIYNGDKLAAYTDATSITGGTPDADAADWYIHSTTFTATDDGALNFDILGGEAFAFTNTLEAGAHILLDSIAVYKDGVADALYTANFSTYDDMPGFIELTSADGMYTAKVSFYPSRFIVVETDDTGATGILAMLLLRRKQLALAAEGGEDVVPEEPVVNKDGYVAVTERETFWAGIQLDSFENVYPDKTYTITFDLKTDDETDDFRLGTTSTTHGKVADGNLGSGAGKLFTSGTPVEGEEGWYSFSCTYTPTEEHAFAFRIFGGYQAKGVTLPNVSKANFYVDNVRLYEDGVEEPILEYNFDTDKYFEDWSGFIANVPDGTPATIELVIPE